MLLRLRQSSRSRAVTALASSSPVERDERLDQVGRDRERARLVDSLPLRVLPDRAEALRSALPGSCASSAPTPSARRASITCQ